MHRIGWFVPLALLTLLQPESAQAGCITPVVVDMGPGEAETEFGPLRFSALQMEVFMSPGRRRRRAERRPAFARKLARQRGTILRGVLAEPLEVATLDCDAQFPVGTVVTHSRTSSWEFVAPEGTTVCDRRLQADEAVVVRPTHLLDFGEL